MPARQRRVGLQEIGLPYAADPAVTKHLAPFLRVRRPAAARGAHPPRRERPGVSDARPLQRRRDESGALRARIVDVMNGWLAGEGFEPLDDRHVLDAPDLDHAVGSSIDILRRGRVGFAHPGGEEETPPRECRGQRRDAWQCGAGEC